MFESLGGGNNVNRVSPSIFPALMFCNYEILATQKIHQQNNGILACKSLSMLHHKFDSTTKRKKGQKG